MKKIKFLIFAILISLGLGIFGNVNDTQKVFAINKYEPILFEHFNYNDLEMSNHISNYDLNISSISEKPSLVLDLSTNEIENEEIYNQVLDSSSNYITIKLKSETIRLQNLVLGFSVGQNFKMITIPFSELKSFDENPIDEIKSTFSLIQISLVDTFDENDFCIKLDGEPSTTLIKDSFIYEISIFEKGDIEGTLIIDEIATGYFDEDNIYQKVLWNDFTGGISIQECANKKTTKISSLGTFETRSILLKTTASVTIEKEQLINENLKYIFLSASGDVDNLKFSYTEDGITYSNEKNYLTNREIGKCRGIKLFYNGRTSVVINKIFVSEYDMVAVKNYTPIIDPLNTTLIDDFYVKQTIFYTTNGHSQTQGQIYKNANCEYRISKTNNNLLKIDDGVLKFDATSLISSTHTINFTAKYNEKYNNQKFLVIKANTNSNDFMDIEISFGQNSSYIPISKCFCDYAIYTSLKSNDISYFDNDYYYLLIDLKASSFNPVKDENIEIGINYTGNSVLNIKEMFLANNDNTFVSFEDYQGENIYADIVSKLPVYVEKEFVLPIISSSTNEKCDEGQVKIKFAISDNKTEFKDLIISQKVTKGDIEITSTFLVENGYYYVVFDATEGNYNINVSAKDSFNNIASKDVNLVVNKIPSNKLPLIAIIFIVLGSLLLVAGITFGIIWLIRRNSLKIKF